MKKTLLLLAVAGTAMASAPAMAQSTKQPFEGFKVEALAGYDITNAGSSVDDDSEIDNDQSIDGFAFGVGTGYDFRSGNLVVGPEAEVTWSTAKTSWDDGDFEGFGLGNVKTNRDIYVGGRVGYVVSPMTMVYAKAGYTNAKFDVRNAVTDVETNRDIDADGWRIGAGVEQQFTDNVYAKLEYRYSNYGKAELDYTGEIPDGQRFDVDLDRHQIMAGVGVRF